MTPGEPGDCEEASEPDLGEERASMFIDDEWTTKCNTCSLYADSSRDFK